MVEINEITDVEKYIKGLKAVVFDLDDTLYGEKQYIKSGYRAVSKLLIQVEDAELKLFKAFEEKKSAFDEVLKNEGIYTEELKQKCLEIYRNQYPEISFYNGVADMLVKIRERGYKIGIITDGRPNGQRAKIKALELDNYVDYIIVTDELGGISYRKPNEKAFCIIREKFDLKFEEMCYVGDNIMKDFIAPEKLGMKTIWFKNRDGIYFFDIKE